MTVRLDEVVAYLNDTLEISAFRDYGPNGLQVQGAQTVDRVVTGVSATLALFERALEAQADLIVVHHGLIWGAGIECVTGALASRLRFLLQHNISLAAYHLPLDKHPRLGNNAGLCDRLGLQAARSGFGHMRGHVLGVAGSWPSPLSRDDAIARISMTVLDGQQPTFVLPHGPATVRKVGVCTGAASDFVEAAAEHGCDLFLTGELAERAVGLARVRQITLVGAGHHATEVFGVQRLVVELQNKFPRLAVQFIDSPSPV